MFACKLVFVNQYSKEQAFTFVFNVFVNQSAEIEADNKTKVNSVECSVTMIPEHKNGQVNLLKDDGKLAVICDIIALDYQLGIDIKAQHYIQKVKQLCRQHTYINPLDLLMER